MFGNGINIFISAAAHIHNYYTFLKIYFYFLTKDNACDGSSAGIIPSSFVHILNASNASLSVALT